MVAKRSLLPWLAVLALVGPACGSASGTPSAAASGTPVEIPVIVAQTGSAAFLGKEETQALQLLQKVENQRGGIGGHPIQFTFYDDQTTPAVDVQLANQVIAKKTSVILGPSVVGSCNAIAPLLTSGPVMYCLSPGIHPKAGSYAFTSAVSTVDMAEALVSYFKGKGFTRIGVITSTDASGQDAEAGIKDVLGRSQYTAVKAGSYEHFNVTDVSVDAQISRIKAGNPQAVIAWSTGTGIATVFKAIQRSGLDVPVGTTNGNMINDQMAQYASFLPKELLIPTTEWPAYSTLPKGKVKDAQKAYFDAFNAAGTKPDQGQALAWDPGLLVIDALRHKGAAATGAQIRDYLGQLKGFVGINGEYDFTASAQRGLTVKQVVVTRWDAAGQAWQLVSGPGVS
jgi:branched-chain amino acid transport system substrate-binding protein